MKLPSDRAVVLIKSLGLIFLLLSSLTLEAAPAFRFHLLSEPASLKSWEQKNSSAGYLLSQITGTLLNYQDHKLIPNLAETCVFTGKLKIKCQLKKDLKWSDGTALTSADFVRAFQALIHPENHAFRADLLFPLKNAEKIYLGQMPKEQLKVSSPKPDVLLLELEKSDPEFLFNLTSPLLAPLPASGIPNIDAIRAKPVSWLSSGAYQIQSWEAQKKIVLTPNLLFWKKNDRPTLEIISVNEDSVALSLYEKGELSFLRRLPTLFIPKYKDRPDFFEVEQFRFDYIGFSSKWKNNPSFRKALASSVHYQDLQNLFHSRGTPGCPGISENLYTEKLCHTFNLEKAKSFWAQAFPDKKSTAVEFLYSKQGGDNHKRTMEFLQSEWLKNLGLKVNVSGMENQIFMDRLKSQPSDLFRKGLAPERPTCLSALQFFKSQHPENFLGFSDKNFDLLLEKLESANKDLEKKKLCNQALHLLIDEAWLIPTGPIHFTILVSTQWSDWKLNELNQLDLSDLKFEKNQKPVSETVNE